MKFLVIDGNSVLNRAFYGIKLLTDKNGQPTNGIYGFLNIFLKLIDDINPNYVAVAFDVKAPTFRVKQYDKYKSNRKATPQELLSQFPIMKDILGLMGYKVIEKPGFEADDIIGTISEMCKKNENMECVIATGDRDSLQLVGGKVTVRIMSTKFGKPITIIYDENSIIEKYNVKPNELIDVKALMGDVSDNIPGVAGIGEKTALSLIAKYHDIETIYDNLDEIDEKPSLKNKLSLSKEIAFMSKDLATICTCVPISLDINEYKIKDRNDEKLLRLLSKLEIFSVIKRLGLDEIQNVLNDNKINDIDRNIISISDNSFEMQKKISNLSNEKIYFLIEDNDYVCFINEEIYRGTDIKFFLKALLNANKNEKNIMFYTHDAKKTHHKMLSLFEESVDIDFDTMIAGYLLNPSATDYDLDRLISIYCEKPVLGTLSEKLKYFIELCAIMENEIVNNELNFLFKDVELPLSLVLADMERCGIKLNQGGLIKFGEDLQEDIERLENNIHMLSGCEFNINSPKQLAKILFEDLNLPRGKKTKSGYSTNADVLEFLIDKHPIIEKILEYRQLMKLKSTYVDGLLKEVKEDNRIHSVFNQTETKTGRISSLQPNMQNIPIRTTQGRTLRKFFEAENGCLLVDGDYSQIELRILADASNDENMIDIFNNDEDIHIRTASEVFNVEIKDVTPQMRAFSKAVNFGIIYGISGFSLAKDIGVSVSEATRYINIYFERFDGVKRYLEEVVERAKEKGYVTTLFNRRRNIPELSSKNKNIESFGERIAKNTPIQGTAADIIKIAMVRVYNKLKENRLKSKLILQVHDELIIEAPEDEVETVKEILKTQMQETTTLKVFLKADVNVGKNWLISHE